MKYETSTLPVADSQSATSAGRRPYQAPQLQPLLSKETDGKALHNPSEITSMIGPS